MLNLQKNFINNEYIANLNFILLMFLPISLLIGSAVINFVIISFDILFLVEVIKKKERIGRNPITKEEHKIMSRKSITFSTSKKINYNINNL